MRSYRIQVHVGCDRWAAALCDDVCDDVCDVSAYQERCSDSKIILKCNCRCRQILYRSRSHQLTAKSHAPTCLAFYAIQCRQCNAIQSKHVLCRYPSGSAVCGRFHQAVEWVKSPPYVRIMYVRTYVSYVRNRTFERRGRLAMAKSILKKSIRKSPKPLQEPQNDCVWCSTRQTTATSSIGPHHQRTARPHFPNILRHTTSPTTI